MQLPPQEWMQWQSTRRVIAALYAGGGEARFVGGCVRDALLGRAVFDIDMASTLPPEEAIIALERADIRVVPTGLAHGTVTAMCEGRSYEITTLRQDVDCDGRHAEVAFTDDWQLDAARRDFTMNALYADAEGNITDFYGGIADARAGSVRFIGDAESRIREDALRILRFFRFYAHYGQGDLDAQGLSACLQTAGLLELLSGERIHMEMFKLLRAPQPQKVLKAMQECTVLTHILLPADAANAPINRLAELEPGHDAERRLALLLRQDATCTEPVLQRWKCANATKARLRSTVPAWDGLPQWDVAQQKAAIRHEGADRFRDQVLLAWAADAEAGSIYATMLELVDSWQVPVLPVTGNDIIAVGFPPGRMVGEVLRQIDAWWEAEDYSPDKDALLEKARSLRA
jgi:poly(A) polymerase